MNAVSRVLFGAALLFGAVALGLLGLDAHLRSVCTEPVTATVVDNVVRTSGGSGGTKSLKGGTTAVAPVFEYEAGGVGRRVESSTASWPPRYEVGEQVRLYLDPDDPETFRADGDNVLRVIAAVFGGFFAVFAAVGVFVRLHSGRGDTKEEKKRIM